MDNQNLVITHTTDPHKYYRNGIEIQSVTAITRLFFPDLYAPYWSAYKAVEEAMGKEVFKAEKPERNPSMEWLNEQKLKFPDIDFDLKERAIQKSWKENASLKAAEGKEEHAILENDAFERGTERSPFDMELYKVIPSFTWENGVKRSLYPDLKELPDGVFPEIILPYKDLYVGTSDKVYIKTIGSTRYVDVEDFKNKTSVSEFADSNALYPLQGMKNHVFNRYTIATSLYMNALEAAGFTPRYMTLKLKSRYQPLNYAKGEVIRVLQYLEEEYPFLDNPYIQLPQ